MFIGAFNSPLHHVLLQPNLITEKLTYTWLIMLIISSCAKSVD